MISSDSISDELCFCEVVTDRLQFFDTYSLFFFLFGQFIFESVFGTSVIGDVFNEILTTEVFIIMIVIDFFIVFDLFFTTFAPDCFDCHTGSAVCLFTFAKELFDSCFGCFGLCGGEGEEKVEFTKSHPEHCNN